MVLDTTDILPTLLDLLDIPKPSSIEGKSVIDAIRSSNPLPCPDKVGYMCAFPSRDVFHEAFKSSGIDPKAFGWRGIRTNKYSFVIHAGYFPENYTPLTYLYNLEDDPCQLMPLDPHSPEYQKTVPILQTQLRAWLLSQNDPFIQQLD